MNMNRHQQGYTLIELMISLLLGSVLIAGFSSLFVQSLKSSKIQSSLNYMMDDGRYSLEVFGRELRRTGSLRSKMTASGGADVVFIADPNTLGSTISFSKGEYIRGEYVAAGTINRFAVRYQLNNATELAVTDPNSTNSACERSILLTAAEDPATEVHVVTLYFYVASNTLYCLAKRENFSDAGKDKISPAEPLISNVKTMAVTYGIDTDADKAPNYYVGEATINGFTTAQWQQVIAVKLSLVLQSEDDNLATSSVTYTIDGATGSPFTATDKRLYRVSSTTVAFRNAI